MVEVEVEGRGRGRGRGHGCDRVAGVGMRDDETEQLQDEVIALTMPMATRVDAIGSRRTRARERVSADRHDDDDNVDDNLDDEDDDHDDGHRHRSTTWGRRVLRLTIVLAAVAAVAVVSACLILSSRQRPLPLSPPRTPPSLVATPDCPAATPDCPAWPLLESAHARSCQLRYPRANWTSLLHHLADRRIFLAYNLHENQAVVIDHVTETLRALRWLCKARTSTTTDTNRLSRNEQQQPQPLTANSLRNCCPHIYVSVYESGSTDATPAQLRLLATQLELMGMQHTIVANGDVRRRDGEERIDFLARVRNAAMEPLYRLSASNKEWFDTAVVGDGGDGGEVGNVTAITQTKTKTKTTRPPPLVVFLNDVYFCAEDILQLLSHHVDVGASSSTPHATTPPPPPHMVCGLDFDDPSNTGHALFYDTWVMRDIHGREVSKRYPFVHEPRALSALHAGAPFAVFCCWNGMVAMQASLWMEHGVRWRSRDRSTRPSADHADEENITNDRCAASECSHVCEDWWSVYGDRTRILVDPIVAVAYERRVYEAIERERWFAAGRLERAGRWWNGSSSLVPSSHFDHIRQPASWRCCELNGKCGEHRVPDRDGVASSMSSSSSSEIVREKPE